MYVLNCMDGHYIMLAGLLTLLRVFYASFDATQEAVNWLSIRRFKTTQACIDALLSNGYEVLRPDQSITVPLQY